MKKASSTLIALALLGMALVPLAGCKKKAPTQTADARPHVTATKPTEKEVAPPPA